MTSINFQRIIILQKRVIYCLRSLWAMRVLKILWKYIFWLDFEIKKTILLSLFTSDVFTVERLSLKVARDDL